MSHGTPPSCVCSSYFTIIPEAKIRILLNRITEHIRKGEMKEAEKECKALENKNKAREYVAHNLACIYWKQGIAVLFSCACSEMPYGSVQGGF